MSTTQAQIEEWGAFFEWATAGEPIDPLVLAHAGNAVLDELISERAGHGIAWQAGCDDGWMDGNYGEDL